MAEPVGDQLPARDGANGAGSLDQLNDAKRLAWEHAANAVRYLASVLNDGDSDIDQRIQAAGELLNFAVKGPY